MDEDDSTPQQSGETSLAQANSSSSGPKKTNSSTNIQPSRKKCGRMGQQDASRKPQSSNMNNTGAAPALSREEKKNALIMQMIERQENLLKRRERKKEKTIKGEGRNGTDCNEGDRRHGGGAVAGSVGTGKQQHTNGIGAGGQHDRNKNGPGQSGTRNSVQYLNGKVHNGRLGKPAVEIHVFFSDEAKVNSGSQRFFYERKQRIEEKQRQEYEDHWARGSMHPLRAAGQQAAPTDQGLQAFRQAFSQQPGGPLLQEPSFLNLNSLASAFHLPQLHNPSQEQVFMHQIYGYPVPSQLDGQQYLEVMNPQHYAEDDYGSSYFSSASKRQRLNEAGNTPPHQLKDHMPMQELLQSESVQLFPSQSPLMPLSSQYGAAPLQANQGQIQQQGRGQQHQDAFLYFQEQNDLQTGREQAALEKQPIQIDNKKPVLNQNQAVSAECPALPNQNNNGKNLLLAAQEASSSQSEDQECCGSLDNLEQYNPDHEQHRALAKTKANSGLGEDGKSIEPTTTPAVVKDEKEPASTENEQQGACCESNRTNELLDVQRIIELTRQIQAQRRPVDV